MAALFYYVGILTYFSVSAEAEAEVTVAAAAAVYGAKSLLSCFKSMTAQRAQIPPPHSRYIFIFRKCGV